MKTIHKQFLEAYDNHENVPEWLIHRVYTDSEIIEEDFGDNDRWTREATSVIKVPVDEKGNYRMFAIFWQEGLTEYQDNIWCGADEVVQSFEEVTKTFNIKSRVYTSKNTGDVQFTAINCKEVE